MLRLFCIPQVNAPYGNVQINKPDLADLARCECRPDQDSPCGPDSECVNRMLMYECHPALCPAGEKCMNQRFQKREYPKSTSFRTAGRGWGLKTLVDIKKVHAQTCNALHFHPSEDIQLHKLLNVLLSQPSKATSSDVLLYPRSSE